MRSWLFVPGDRPERFDKAVASGADMVVLDLEDAVRAEAKDAARETIAGWLTQGSRVAVRINGIGTRWHADDVALLQSPGIVAVLLPKAEQAEALKSFAAALPDSVVIVPLIETALGIWNARELAAAPGVARMAFGSVDFQLDCGMDGNPQSLLYARSRLVLTSAIARIAPPVDGVTLRLDDIKQLRSDVAAARSLGFGGKLCIHPSQVAHVNAGFQPDADALARARKIVDAAMTSGRGAFRLDGQLIDEPVIEQAKRILAWANRS